MTVTPKSRIDRQHFGSVLRDVTQSIQQLLKKDISDNGNAADTTEDVLKTYNLPAGTLKAAGGQYLRIIARGRTAANGDNKTIKLKFGSQVIATPTAATNNKKWWLELEVFRTGNSTQYISGSGCVDVTPVSPVTVTNSAETDTAAIAIVVTGQASVANANDVVCEALTVELIGGQGS